MTHRFSNSTSAAVRGGVRLSLALALVVLLAGMGRGEIIDPNQPPLVNQPEDFERTGAAVGPAFRVSMRVLPQEVQVGQEFTLTVRIQATGPCPHPPSRPQLRDLKPFQKEQFQMERADKKKLGRPDRTPDKNTWEFDYKLKPLSDAVQRIPSWTFVYWKPSGSPVVPGRYESPRVDGVPLTVKPKPAEAKPVVQVPIQAPEAILQPVEGPALLSRQGTAEVPALPILLLLLLAPPLVAIDGYLIWRRLFPDAAKRAHIRRSLAAR
jgi:hypothetical protein